MTAARVVLALLLLTVSVNADSVKVHLSDVKEGTAFVEAWYQVPQDAHPTDRIALYPQDVGNINTTDPIRYVFVPNSLAAANSRVTAQ